MRFSIHPSIHEIWTAQRPDAVQEPEPDFMEAIDNDPTLPWINWRTGGADPALTPNCRHIITS